MGKQCWSQAVSGSLGHSVLQTPALVYSVFLVCVQLSILVSSLRQVYVTTEHASIHI